MGVFLRNGDPIFSVAAKLLPLHPDLVRAVINCAEINAIQINVRANELKSIVHSRALEAGMLKSGLREPIPNYIQSKLTCSAVHFNKSRIKYFYVILLAKS